MTEEELFARYPSFSEKAITDKLVDLIECEYISTRDRGEDFVFHITRAGEAALARFNARARGGK